MNTTTLQVPLTKSLKLSSTKVAREYGFSSLQEAVRVFLTQLANRVVTVQLTSSAADEYLTPEQEKILTEKYLEARKDIKEGRGYSAKSAEEMIEHLRSI